MLEKRTFYFNAAVSLFYFIFILFITGILLGLIINILYQEFSLRLLKIAFINSLFLCFGMFLNFILFKFLIFKLHNIFIILFSFLLITGVSVAGFIFIVFNEPLFFLYQSNIAYVYILINFLFVVSFSLLSTGLMIYQRMLLVKEKEIEEEKKLREKIEENLFKSKINPHFLFNTLNLIISLLNDNEKSEKALLSLSDLLRYNLDMNNFEKISVKKEIEIIEKYLFIQKLRFEKRLNYKINCSADFQVPPFIIQPLVENCIIHNIKETDQLFIEINIYNEDNYNIISIADSQKKINNTMLGKGMGLDITKKRIELTNGDFIIRDGGIIIKYYEN